MSGNWQTAYDAQMDLWRFWQSEVGAGYADGYAASTRFIKDGSPNLTDPNRDERIGHESLTAAILQQKNVMFDAEPIFVEDDMVTMIESAARSFEIEPLQDHDLLIPTGFALFERGIVLNDVRGKPFPVRALAWEQANVHMFADETRGTTPGIMLSAYLHVDDEKVADREWQRGNKTYYDSVLAFGPLQMVHMTPWPFGFDYGIFDTQHEVEGKTLNLAHRLEGFIDDEPVTQEMADAALGVQRLAQVMWRLMAQTISVHVKQPTPRASKKRAKKFMFTDTKYVTVITLRKPKPVYGKDHIAAFVDWDHRWLVAGHWRKQWYPSLNAHRQIWINPFVKGPEDKPLVIREMRAFEFRQ